MIQVGGGSADSMLLWAVEFPPIPAKRGDYGKGLQQWQTNHRPILSPARRILDSIPTLSRGDITVSHQD